MFRLAIAMLGAVSIAACSGEPAGEEPASGAEATETASGGEEAVTLTAEGYGPLRIGMTLDEIVAAMGADSDPEAVGGPEPEMCDQFHPENAPGGLLVMVEEGVLTRITLMDPGVMTDAGLEVGAGADAVRAAYGESVYAMPHTYAEAPGEYLTVWATGQQTEPYVQDGDARGIRYEIGEDGNVQFIHAGGPSIQYVEGCL